jgi:hypothetical protein
MDRREDDVGGNGLEEHGVAPSLECLHDGVLAEPSRDGHQRDSVRLGGASDVGGQLTPTGARAETQIREDDLGTKPLGLLKGITRRHGRRHAESDTRAPMRVHLARILVVLHDQDLGSTVGSGLDRHRWPPRAAVAGPSASAITGMSCVPLASQRRTQCAVSDAQARATV